MKPIQIQLCAICYSATTSSENVKKLFSDEGVAFCRGSRLAPSEPECDLRKISLIYIDLWNAELKSDHATPDPLYRPGDNWITTYTITATDPEVRLTGWNGDQGREWYDIDQVFLQYIWEEGRGSFPKARGRGHSDLMIFSASALPGKCFLDSVR